MDNNVHTTTLQKLHSPFSYIFEIGPSNSDNMDNTEHFLFPGCMAVVMVMAGVMVMVVVMVMIVCGVAVTVPMVMVMTMVLSMPGMIMKMFVVMMVTAMIVLFRMHICMGSSFIF
jgi:hypothetical protein